MATENFNPAFNPDGSVADNLAISGSGGADGLTIIDFTTGTCGDILDYSDLLKNANSTYNGENLFSTGQINLVQSGQDTILQFDADGSGNPKQAITMANLYLIAQKRPKRKSIKNKTKN